MKLKITLKGNSANNKYPLVKISVNDKIFYNDPVAETFEIEIEPLIQKNNQLTIEHYNKQNHDTVVDKNGNITEDLSVELVSIEIDDIKILETVLYSMPYYVHWPDNLVKEFESRGETPPLCLTNNLYFGFNGIYKFDFSDNVVVEYYKQFWLDEVQAHQNQTSVDGDNEVFERMGEKVAVNQSADFTIHDLKRLVLNDRN